MMKETRLACVSAVIFAIVIPTLVTWVYFDLLADDPGRMQRTAYAVGKLIQFGFPICWVGFWLRRQSWDAGPLSGLRREPQMTRRQSVLFGVGFGLLAVAAMLVIYRGMFRPETIAALAGEAAGRVEDFSVDSTPKFAGLGLFYSLVHSFLEEYYFRWFVFGQLRRLMPFLQAMVISALAFMSHHVIVLGHYFDGLSVQTVVLSLAIAVGGGVWAWQYERSQSLLGPWVSHLVVDAGIFLVGYDMLRESLV